MTLTESNSDKRTYITRVPQGMIIFTVPVTIVRYGGNVTGMAMWPALTVIEENLGYVPGATCMAIELGSFGWDDIENGLTIHATAYYVSWWRRSAPAVYQRREYGVGAGQGGWPTKEEKAQAKRWWLGFPRWAS